MPPDRVFARIETFIRKMDTITNPSDYIQFFSDHGTLATLGSPSLPVYDWKTEVKNVLKPPGSWHFRLKASKRVIIKRNDHGNIIVKGDIFYSSDLSAFSGICKKGKTAANISPGILPTAVVKTEKMKDIKNLLAKHFGENWQEIETLSFYTELVVNQEMLRAQGYEENTVNEDADEGFPV